MPPGLVDRQSRDPKNFTMAQWQQARRMKTTPRAIRQDFEESWTLSHDWQSFEQALSDREYALAMGERAGFVVLDHRCEIFAGDKMDGVKVKDIRVRLVDEKALRTVAQTSKWIAERMRTKLSQLHDHQASVIAQRRTELENRRAALVKDQRAQRRTLEKTQRSRWSYETCARQARFNKGLKGLWDRLTGKRTRIERQNQQETLSVLHRDQAEKDAMIFAHLEQRQTLQRRIERLGEFEHKRSNDLAQDVRQYRDIVEQKREAFKPDTTHKPSPTLKR